MMTSASCSRESGAKMCAVADATFLKGHSSCIILDFILDCFASTETLSVQPLTMTGPEVGTRSVK